MPNCLPFKLERRFNNYNDYVNYKAQLFDYSIDHTKRQNCNDCKNSDHKMKIQYCYCSNEDCFIDGEKCPKRYRVHTCLKHSEKALQKVALFSLNRHTSNVCSKQNVRGLSPIVKDLVENLISDYRLRPFKIWIKLHKRKYKKQIDFC